MDGKINLIDARINYCFILLASFFLISCKEKPTLQSVKELNSYPSGSGIEYFDNHIYLIGDDAAYILKMNIALDSVDTISLYDNKQKRISKDIKADLEGITLVTHNNDSLLFLVGSGSLAPYRNSAWLINHATKERREIRLDTFYSRLTASGIEEINIEGIAMVSDEIVMVNRGNKSHPRNYLVFTSDNFWGNQANAPIRLVTTGFNPDTSFFNGISGLDYSAQTDRLLLTVSTENTYNSYADGVIGKSYLWIINDLLSKRRMVAMNPNKVIDLDALDKRFEGHKIESVCIISETKSEMNLMLVADDDNGKTMFFNIKLPE
jgi:hypothetical protein